MTGLTYTLATPPNIASAIACVQIRASSPASLDGFASAHGLAVTPARPALRDLLGIDEGLVLRWDDRTLDLFPHAGPAILRRLTARLEELGLTRSHGYAYPEAGDEVEQRALTALAAAASPLAVDLLLAQPGRWRVHQGGQGLADAGVLRRLLVPPFVAAVGAPNIGKSTLLNTLAGRSVAIVADEPGTTRDHVGAMLDLAGLTVRYLDTPGRLDAPSGVDRTAIELADEAVRHSDLVLACGDPSTAPGPVEHPAVLKVCLRADLGEPAWSPDARVSARDMRGVPELVRAVRDALVPPEALADTRPWRFWGDGDAGSDPRPAAS